MRVLALREPVHAQRLAHHPPDRVTWVERRVRILEDHLHPAPQRAELALAQVGDVDAVEDDLARGRVVEAQQRAPDRGLAAPGLSDEPEGLAALDVDRDAVDRLHVADVAVEHDPAADREPDLQVLDVDEGIAHAAGPSLDRSHSSAGTGLKQATWWPCSIGCSCGTSRRDCSTS